MAGPRAITGYTCRGCGGADLSVFFEARAVPALVNVLHATKKSAMECERGDIVLALCRHCELISNVAFDPSKLAYGTSYENPLHHSELFRGYAAGLAANLVERFDLRGKTILEIGCGDGSFLRLLCQRGGNRGVGFDPSFPGPEPRDDEGIEIVEDFYSEKYSHVHADFILSRHTLEHVEKPGVFLASVRRSIGDRMGTPLFIEVPNGSYILENHFVWDIIYEHASYFRARSLCMALENAGFRMERIYEAFSGQYLCAEGLAADNADLQLDIDRRRQEGMEPGNEISDFVSGYQEYLRSWDGRLRELRALGTKMAVWGAGSKGVTFLNTFDVRGLIELVVDINPKKQGMFVAGGGQRIVAPDELSEARPGAVLVVNPVYREEVGVHLAKLGIVTEIMTL